MAPFNPHFPRNGIETGLNIMYFLDQYNDSHASRHATVKIEKSTRLYKDLHARLWMKTLPGVCYPYPAEGPSMVLIHSSSPLGEGNRATGLYRTGNTGQDALCRTKGQEERGPSPENTREPNTGPW